MNTRELFVLVEGPSDARFIRGVLPRVAPELGFKLIEHSRRPHREVNQIIRLRHRKEAPVLFLTDRDHAPCNESRKTKRKEALPDLEARDLIVVSREIESWYLAGINAETARALSVPAQTDDCVKEHFARIRPSRFDSDIDFMAEILKTFDVDCARARNRCFDYFVRRLNELIT